MRESKPIVCTLRPNELVARCKQWHEVLARARAVVKAVPGGVTIRFPGDPQVIVEIEELARLERSCCEWMTLDLRREQNGEATLLMTANSKEGAEMIAAITAV